MIETCTIDNFNYNGRIANEYRLGKLDNNFNSEFMIRSVSFLE